MSAIGIFSVMPSVRQRRGWAALAVLALALLSLRPACEAWLAHWSAGNAHRHAAAIHEQLNGAPAHSPHEQLCCGSIEAAALVKPTDLLPWRSAQTPPPTLLPSMHVALMAATPLLHALIASVIPPGNPPFYVRSARILR